HRRCRGDRRGAVVLPRRDPRDGGAGRRGPRRPHEGVAARTRGNRPSHLPALVERAGQRMGLSAEEFRVHLEMTAATAGVPLPEIVLPDSRHLLLGRMRFHYLDWGTAG